MHEGHNTIYYPTLVSSPVSRTFFSDVVSGRRHTQRKRCVSDQCMYQVELDIEPAVYPSPYKTLEPLTRVGLSPLSCSRSVAHLNGCKIRL